MNCVPRAGLFLFATLPGPASVALLLLKSRLVGCGLIDLAGLHQANIRTQTTVGRAQSLLHPVSFHFVQRHGEGREVIILFRRTANRKEKNENELFISCTNIGWCTPGRWNNSWTQRGPFNLGKVTSIKVSTLCAIWLIYWEKTWQDSVHLCSFPHFQSIGRYGLPLNDRMSLC